MVYDGVLKPLHFSNMCLFVQHASLLLLTRYFLAMHVSPHNLEVLASAYGNWVKRLAKNIVILLMAVQRLLSGLLKQCTLDVTEYTLIVL